jgi:hypothetical protein
MSHFEPTERILEQDTALVLAIEALCRLQKSGPLERALVPFQLEAYRHRLRATGEVAPWWMGEEILRASQPAAKNRAVVWLSEN